MLGASALSGDKLAGPFRKAGIWVVGALSAFLLLARCDVENVSALQHAGWSQLETSLIARLDCCRTL